MRCQQCGKDIADKCVCPYCGKEQQETDPFYSLGDLLDNAETFEFNSNVEEVAPSVDKPRYDDMLEVGGFEAMDELTWDAEESEPVYGDAPAVGGFKAMDALTWDAEESEPVYGDAPAVGGFKAMDALTWDAEESEPVYGDAPAVGGFEAMDELTWEAEESEPVYSDKPAVGGFTNMDSLLTDDTKTKLTAFVWKRWMTIAAGIAVLLLSATVSFRNQGGLSNPKLNIAIESYIQNEICAGESIPIMLQYQNALLEAITYEVQSCSMVRGTMNVKFTYVDVLQLADSVSGSNITEDYYYRTCIEAIRSGKCKMITEIIPVDFESSAGGYSLIDSDPLTNVLSGGMLNYYLGLLEGADYE